MAEGTPCTQARQAYGPPSTSEKDNSEKNGFYHLLPSPNAAKGEKAGLHVNTPLKSTKTTYESYDFSVFDTTPPQNFNVLIYTAQVTPPPGWLQKRRVTPSKESVPCGF